jgi:hypothetical protein
MKKYAFKTFILIFIITLSSCRKASKELLAKKALKELIFKSDDVAPILKANFNDDVLETFAKSLDELQIKSLTKQIENNKPLAQLLNSNPKTISIWSFLSGSKYSGDIEIIKYFKDLPENQFVLRLTNGKRDIVDLSNGNVLARVSDNSILVIKLENNPFLNLKKFAPKTNYTINKTSYSIDNLGRVSIVKSPLLKLNKNIAANIDNSSHILSLKFGGINFDINKALISKDAFLPINETWQKALTQRTKISEVNIKSFYRDNTTIPDAFNVSYYRDGQRVIVHIPNNFKKKYESIFDQLRKPAVGKFINGSKATRAFPDDISLTGNKLFYEGKEFASINSNTKTILVQRRAALKNGINPLLSHPKLLEDYKYVVQDGKNTHIFKTDNLGRVSETEHFIVAKYSKTRNVVEQNNAKLFGDEISSKTTNKNLNRGQHLKLSDEGGHYLADSAGGIPESINITSQAHKVNHSEKWRAMENKITSAVKNGDDVIVKNKQIFTDNSRRSSGSIYELNINGKTEKFTFDNANYTLSEI